MNEKKIHKTIIKTTDDFLADVARFFPDDNEDIKLVAVFGSTLGKGITKHVARYVLKYGKEIEERDEIFFTKNKRQIFIGLPEDKVDRFETLILQSGHNKEKLWEYFDIFLFVSREYEKLYPNFSNEKQSQKTVPKFCQ